MLATTRFHAPSLVRLAGLMTFACAAALPTYADHTKRVSLDSGTVVAVHLDDALSSNGSQKGDTFTATVKDDARNMASFPAGAQIEGVVRFAQPNKDKHPGILDLAFRKVILPDGREYNINGSLIGLDSKSATRTKDGRLVATQSHRTDRLTFVGYGAGAGLLVGLLADKKNTLRDVLLGAGAGYLYGALEKGHSNPRDVALKAGTELGVRLDNRLTYNRNIKDTGGL